MEYLRKPLSINQSQRLLKFFQITYRLSLITQNTLTDAATTFDEYIWEQSHLSWEPPNPQWFQEYNSLNVLQPVTRKDQEHV